MCLKLRGVLIFGEEVLVFLLNPGRLSVSLGAVGFLSRGDPAKELPPLNSALKFFWGVLDLLSYSRVLWNKISKNVFETPSSIALK